jgi:leader peptidase (prepilin peptidase)/N-methyltransferase
MPAAVATVFAGALGAVFGSFFNVVAYRLPRHQSLIHPPSSCPSCQQPIKAYDNVPVLGWLMLRGSCRSCGARISPRYPIVEALTAALAAAVVLVGGSSYAIVSGLVLVAVLVPISLIDLDQRIIPNKLTLPASLAAIVIALVLKPAVLPSHLLAGGAAAGFLLLFALAYPSGMGMGDVKLAGVLGLFLGASVAVAVLAAVFAATLVGVGVMVRVGVERGRKVAVPFGPFLAIGGVLAVLAGPQILHWYLHLGI